jgi:hypothetical protein
MNYAENAVLLLLYPLLPEQPSAQTTQETSLYFQSTGAC